MSHRYRTSLFACVFLLLFTGAEVAHAGFGITPPYVRNSSLTRNSVYEQEVIMVRGNPDTELVATVTVDAPEVESWIEVLEGTEILLPRGENRIPMTVRVTVPSDAEFTDYSGRIRIRTQPSDEQVQEGAVSITLGAQVSINLTVIDRIIEEFRIRRVQLPELNAGRQIGWLYFPGRIAFDMRVENTGNVDFAPTRVTFDIYDVRGEALLEQTENLGRIRKVAPYATENVIAQVPTRLPPGNYRARYNIYNKDEINHSGELNMIIREYGTVQAAGFGLRGLSTPHLISVMLPILGILIVVMYTGYHLYYKRNYRRKRYV